MSFDPISVLLLILCPLAWSAFDFARKRLSALGSASPVTMTLALVQLPVVAAWAAVALASSQTPAAGLANAPGWPESAYWLPALGSLAVGVLGTVAFQHAVHQSPLSAVIPLLSLTPAVASILGALVLDEIPSTRQWVGIALVVAGVFLINGGDRLDAKGLQPKAVVTAWLREPGSLSMVIAAVFFAAAPLFDKQALLAASLPVHMTFVVAGVVLVLGGHLALTGRLGETRRLFASPRLLLVGGAISLLAFALQLAAVQRVWVGLLETAKRSVGAAAALVVGAVVLGEAVRPMRVIAVLIMTIGVILVTL